MDHDRTLRQHGQFWDAVAAEAAPIGEARMLIEALLRADEIAGRDVLDAGCGAGDYAAAFEGMGARRAAGFDLSAGSLSRARHKAPGLTLAVASLGAIPFPAASFDVVWAWGVLHYAPDAEGALREMVRVLRPGGVMVVHTLRAGFWASFERAVSGVLSRSPRPLQSALLSAGVRLVPFAARLAGKGAPSTSTSKTLRQKLHERFFVPGPVAAFRFERLAAILSLQCDVTEGHPPVSDLFGRDMSMTLVARKRPAAAANERPA